MSNIKLVICGLIATLVLALGGIVWLASQGLPIPDVLQNLAVGALTALAGVLTGRATSGRGGRQRA